MAGAADDDYLAAEGLIVDRLRAELPDTVDVKTAVDLQGLDELAQRTEAVYVIYDGDEPGDTGGEGLRQVVRQRWLCVVAVRHRNSKTGEVTRRKAGPLMSSVHKALAGYVLGPGFQPIRRIGTVPPGYSDNYGYFPIAYVVGTAH